MAEAEDREAFWRERFDMTGEEPWTRLFRLVASEGLPRHCIGASKRRTNVYSEERTVGTPQRCAKAKEHDLIPSCLLLAAPAIENLLKGVLVTLQPGTA